MSGELFQSCWFVGGGWYRWVEARAVGSGASDLYLVEADTDHSRRFYDPRQDYPGLFRTFAEVEPTESGFLSFANSYGLLGELQMIDRRVTSPGDRKGIAEFGPGESLTLWAKESGDMAFAVRLWDLLRAGAEGKSELQRLFRWHQDNDGRLRGVYLDTHPGLPEDQPRPPGSRGAWICADFVYPEWLDRLRIGDPFLPARVYLHRLVNEGLARRASPRLLHRGAKDLYSSVLRIVPASLIGCLWLQLAEAISSGLEFRQCLACKKWFEVTVRARADKRTCSGACRNKLYRARQEAARTMRAQGMKPKEIATELEIDLASVKRWVKERKG
jgi:hypothetical protein